jgi:hypothetical protein
MTFPTAIQSLSVAAALALAGCMSAEAPSEPADPLNKTAYEVKTGCTVLDDFLGSFGNDLACISGDFESCVNSIARNSNPVLKCYDIEIPAGIDSPDEFEDFAAEFNAQLSKYDTPAGQRQIIDCLCPGGGPSASGPFDASNSTSGTGFSSGASTSAKGFSSSSSTSGTGYSSGGSTSGTGFSAK